MSRSPKKLKILRREPERGDVVRRISWADRSLTVVLEHNDRKVRLGEKPEIWYVIDFVQVIDLPMSTRRGLRQEKWSLDDWTQVLGY